jgi:drug/metabolite transporter (DMT)-like permease
MAIDEVETMRHRCAMPTHARLSDWSALIMLVAIWGSSFAMSKVAVTHLDAAWVAGLRLAVAAVVLVPYAAITGHSMKASGEQWWKFSWLAFIGHAVPFFLITWGLQFISSGVSGLLMGAIPLILVVMAHFALPEERLTAPKATGFVLGFVGIFILMGPEQLLNFRFSGNELIGELAVLAGCVCYAIHAVSAKRMGVDNPVKQTAAVCFLAAIMGVGLALVLNPLGIIGKPASAYWAVLGLGLLPTAFASVVSYWLMHRVGPSFVAYANYLVPGFALLLGAATLNEPLELSSLASLALVVGGIAISRLQTFSLQRNMS